MVVFNAELPESLAHEALSRAGVGDQAIRSAHGWSNAVWIGPTHVVRVTTGRLEGSLAHEAHVVGHLAGNGLPVPVVVTHGRVAELPSGGDRPGEWLVSERIDAPTLADAWPALSPAERRRCGNALGQLLRQLHEVPVGDVTAPAWWREAVAPGGPRHNAYHPPPDVGLAMAAEAEDLPGADRALARAAHDLLTGTADAFVATSAAPPVIVHTDCHGSNLLVGPPGRVRLLDFEATRLGEPDVEIGMLLRWCALAHEQPAHPGRRSPVVPGDAVELAQHVADAYPALFGHPRLRDRLLAYEIHWRLVQVHLQTRWSADRPGDLPGPRAAWTDLARVLDGRSHLGEFATLIGS